MDGFTIVKRVKVSGLNAGLSMRLVLLLLDHALCQSPYTNGLFISPFFLKV